jgi:hypothetical protein
MYILEKAGEYVGRTAVHFMLITNSIDRAIKTAAANEFDRLAADPANLEKAEEYKGKASNQGRHK